MTRAGFCAELAAIVAASAFLAGCMRPLTKAAVKGDAKGVAALIEAGADVNAQDGWSQPYVNLTPLMSAAYYGNEDVVRLLLDRGADVNGKDSGGGTALRHAAQAGQARIVELLISRGADVDSTVAWLEGCGAASCRAGVSLINRILAKHGEAGKATAAPEKRVTSAIDHPSYRLPERPDDFAVVIGIEKYSDLPDARFAERDAEAVKEHMLALGIPSRNVVHLAGEKAGYKAIEKFIETWLPRNVNESSRVFFYFSGHGAPDATSGRAYLLPWDGDPSFLDNTGYPLQRLYDGLGALKARNVIVVLDACFSGAGGRSVLAKGSRPLVTKIEAVPSLDRNLTIFSATSGDQITSTIEDQGHGTFTYYFLRGLSGEARDSRGAVTAKGIHGFLKPKVQDAARRQNRDQSPELRGSQENVEVARFLE